MRRYPSNIKNYSQVPSAVEVYRSVLAQQPDSSVTISSIGFLTNLDDLLASGPDQHSPLSGPALVAAKVKSIVVMGGNYPSSGGKMTWNFGGGSDVAVYVYLEDPHPLVQASRAAQI